MIENLGLKYSRCLRIWFCEACSYWQRNEPAYQHECKRATA